MPDLSKLNLNFEIHNPYAKVLERGNALLDEFGLTEQGWTFDLSNEKNTLGCCHYDKKRIVFSTYYIDIPWEEIEDTIRHEIAHALVGSDHGHDAVWKRKCLEVGARAERCAPKEIKSAAKYNYVLRCSCCNREVGKRYRLRANILRYTSRCCGAELQAYEIVR